MIAVLLGFAIASLAAPALVRLVGRRAFIALAAVSAGATVWAALQAPAVLGGQPLRERVDWVPQLDLALSFRMDHLAWVLVLIVTGVGALVLLYCWRYFSDDEPGLGRFAGLLTAFAGVMFGLVTSDDVLLLVTFWEATSVLSYLLIGHDRSTREARSAALQAMLVTTLGGLSMLVGVILLASLAGTTSLSGILADPPGGPAAVTAIVLILVGALSKSALVPFHFWLPAAMAAPTPVSAYLHAAAMVKAGVYLVARLAPGFADLPGWRFVIVVAGGVTMLLGALRALRQYDLKLVLAYGTVSQLGLLVLVIGFGGHDVALAGLALLVAHALFKATLFLVVGVIDHDAHTRDMRELAGLWRRRPVLFAISVVAAASMAGVPPLLGFVAKDAVLAGMFDAAVQGDGWAWVAVTVAALGSVLTVAYSVRFVRGAFGGAGEATPLTRADPFILLAPVLLTIGTLGFGVAASLLDPLLTPWPNLFGYGGDAHLALWHGFEPALFMSLGILALGAVLAWQRARVARAQAAMHHGVTAPRMYRATVRGLDRVALWVASAIQRGGLPGYLATALVVLVLGLGAATAAGRLWPDALVLWDSPAQVVVAVLMIAAAIAAARAKQRIAAALLVGVTGYGLVMLFAVQGAPDLALTQALVETITIVVFVLVLRRLPTALGSRHRPVKHALRLTIGVGVGVVMATVGAIALGAREAPGIAARLPELASEQGHGRNVVNVMLVDIRAWDTLGELSVLIAVATGVASLLFVTGRVGGAPRLSDARSREPVVETASVPVAPDGRRRYTWLLAGRTLSPRNRSIILEVVVRVLFHPALLVSLFLLFAGHNAPGGGFAAGLLAGLALVTRYLAGGRYELGEAAPVDAGKLLGFGMILAAGTAVGSLFFGFAVLQSAWFEFDVPVLGTVSIGTSTLFDIGVYLVVVGVVLDILRSLGGEVDRQQEDRVDEQTERAR